MRSWQPRAPGGAFTEAGLLAVHRAILEPSEAVLAHNAGFLREDAATHVIVFSDEEDQSSPRLTSADFIGAYAARASSGRGAPSFSAWVGPRPLGCTSASTSAVAGEVYLSVSEAVGGVVASICDPAVDALEAIGTNILPHRASVVLTRTPLRAPRVTVRIGGRVWVGQEAQVSGACDPDDCFRFQVGADRRVGFLDGWRAPAGARVEVAYDAVLQ